MLAGPRLREDGSQVNLKGFAVGNSLGTVPDEDGGDGGAESAPATDMMARCNAASSKAARQILRPLPVAHLSLYPSPLKNIRLCADPMHSPFRQPKLLSQC